LVWGLIFNDEKVLGRQAVAFSLLSNIYCSTKQPVTHQLHYNWAFKNIQEESTVELSQWRVWLKSAIKYMSRMSAKRWDMHKCHQ